MNIKIKVIIMVFGLSQLFSCGQSNRLSNWLENEKKLSPKDAEIMTQWLRANQLKAEDFEVSPKGLAKSNAVKVIDKQVHAIRAKGVSDLTGLSGLSQLTDLELNHVKSSDLNACPAQLHYLRLSGKSLTSLSGTASCQHLRRVKIVHSGIQSIAPLFSLPELSEVTASYNQLHEVEISQSLAKLQHLDLSKNAINSFSLTAPLAQLQRLDLRSNQITMLNLGQHTPKLNKLFLKDNQIKNTQQINVINSLSYIELKQNPLNDTASLASWPNLQSIDVDDSLKLASELADKRRTYPQSAEALQMAEARHLKAKYLEGVRFVEKKPHAFSGRAYHLSRKLKQMFSLTPDRTEVSGEVTIKELNGGFMLTLADTDNVLYYGRKVTIKAAVSVEQGPISIYSPIEEDFWQMAALFVDTPVKERPKEANDLILKGYLITTVKPGETVNKQFNLSPLAGEFNLLINADEGSAQNIKLSIK